MIVQRKKNNDCNKFSGAVGYTSKARPSREAVETLSSFMLSNYNRDTRKKKIKNTISYLQLATWYIFPLRHFFRNYVNLSIFNNEYWKCFRKKLSGKSLGKKTQNLFCRVIGEVSSYIYIVYIHTNRDRR